MIIDSRGFLSSCFLNNFSTTGEPMKGIKYTAFFLIIILILVFKYGWLYIQALASDAHVALLQLIGMTFRRVNARIIVESRIMAKKSGT